MPQKFAAKTEPPKENKIKIKKRYWRIFIW
jgi:hypothetical protein